MHRMPATQSLLAVHLASRSARAGSTWTTCPATPVACPNTPQSSYINEPSDPSAAFTCDGCAPTTPTPRSYSTPRSQSTPISRRPSTYAFRTLFEPTRGYTYEVYMCPGESVLTRIPLGPSSHAMLRAICKTADLLVL